MPKAVRRDPRAVGLRALGIVERGRTLRDAIRQSRVERQRLNAYLAWRVRQTASVGRRERAAASAA